MARTYFAPSSPICVGLSRVGSLLCVASAAAAWPGGWRICFQYDLITELAGKLVLALAGSSAGAEGQGLPSVAQASFHTAWWLGSKGECPKKPAEAAWLFLTSLLSEVAWLLPYFVGSGSHRCPPTSKGRGPLDGRSIRELVNMF